MKSILPAILFALGTVLSPLSARAQDAEQLIQQVRVSATLQQTDLYGQIRKEGNKTPISLFMRGQDLQFALGADGNERFHMRLGDEKCDLFSLDSSGKTQIFPSKKLVENIKGTDVTYEDLTLRFLYWPGAKLEGEETIRGADCYRIRLDNPRKDGAFGVVYVWVHKQYGAFWHIRAHDRNGVPIKEFLVNDVMKLPNGNYTIKQMRLNTLAPDGRVQSVTYLEFNAPEKKGPSGPR
jgi:Outer membrane lipoprotein-sorting protein